MVKLIENIGEAARCVTDDTKSIHDQIPWATIISMRNHLVHRYFRIDLNAVWDVPSNHLPPLIAQLELVVPPESPPSHPSKEIP